MFSADIRYHRGDFNLNVKLDLQPGQVHALIGASGSGKTTLLRLLSGLLNPSDGQVVSGDTELFNSVSGLNLSPQKRNVGLVFQDYALFNHMTIFQNIAYGAKTDDSEYVVKYWLDTVRLKDKADCYPEQLSGGEKQRVALARALAASPDVLLMDEPFAALNTHLRLGLRRDLKRLVRDSGIPVLIAIHDLEEAQMMADHVTILSKGKILQSGKTEEVFANPNSVASAHSLGWHNVLSADLLEKGFFAGGQESVSNIIIPPSAFILAENNPDITAIVIDKIILRHKIYYDIQIDSGGLMQLEFNRDSKTLHTGQKYGFTLDKSEILYIK